jgi:hypothetical protein
MKMLSAFTLAIGLIGCASKPVIYYHAPKDKAVANSASKNVNGLRFQERIKAYSLGRYRDSRNPRIMHEKHLAYRVEEDASWDYSPNYVSLGSKASNPNLFQSAEAEVEMKKQQDHNALLTEQNKLLSKKLDQVEEENKQISQLIKENHELQKTLNQVQVESQNFRKNLEEKSHAQTVVEQPKKPSLWERFTSLMPNKNK